MLNPTLMDHPFTYRVTKDGQSPINKWRNALEGPISEHMPDFAKVLESRRNEDPVARVKAHQMLRIATGAAEMARAAGEMKYASESSHTENRTVMANIADFITQEIHRSLDVWQRQVATRYVSVQPLTQLSGFFFFDNHSGNPNTGTEFDLTDVNAFPSGYGDLEEGGPVDAVGVGLDSQSVTATWKALRSPVTWQSQVKLMTEHGISARDWSDSTAAHVLSQMVDRQIVDSLIEFAETNPRGPVHFDPDPPSAIADNPDQVKAYKRSFISEALTRVGVEMYADRYVRPNFYWAGTNVIQLLAETPEMFADNDGNAAFDQEIVAGSQLTAEKLRTSGAEVIHDPAMDPDTMVAGHTNPMNPFWAGFVFGPVGAASLATAWWMDPNTLVDQRARAIAFAYLGVRSSQYRIIKLTDEAEPT